MYIFTIYMQVIAVGWAEAFIYLIISQETQERRLRQECGCSSVASFLIFSLLRSLGEKWQGLELG